MDALHGLLSVGRAESIRALPAALKPACRGIAWMIAGALLLMGATLVVRRAAGAFVAPLPPLLLLAAALAAVVAAFAACLAWRAGGSTGGGPRSESAWGGTLTVGLLLLGAALTQPGASVAALAVFWTLLIAAEAAVWGPRVVGVVTRAAPAAPSEKADDNVWQQVSRERGPDGRETVHGWLRVELSAGQRTAVTHVAICPPLRDAPQVTVRQTAGLEARLKAAQVLPHGIRFEIKLAAAADRPREVRLEFSAVWPGVRG